MTERLNGNFIDDGENLAHALAELFAPMASDRQAEFFNHLAELVKKWPNPAPLQWRYMQTDLTHEGKALLDDMKDNTDQTP